MIALFALAAFAQEPVSEADATARILELQQKLDQTVLVAAVGTTAQPAARRMAKANPGHVEATLVSNIGDAEAEMKRVLDLHGVACGVRLDWVGEDRFRITSHGACGEGLALPAAADAPPDDSSLTAQQVATRAAEIQAKAGTVVLLGAVGFDAFPVARDLAKGAPTRFSAVRLSETTGDAAAAMDRAMGTQKAACGIRVEMAAPDRYRLTRHGTCADPKPVVPEPPPVAEAPPVADAPPVAEAPPVAASPGVVYESGATASSGAAPPAVPARSAAASLDLDPLVKAQWQIALVESQLPDPTTALLTSAIVGFGSGHYYVGATETGHVHLGVQVAGLATTVIGAVMAYNGDPSGNAVRGLGSVVFSTSRVVEMVTVPYAARAEAKAQIERQLR